MVVRVILSVENELAFKSTLHFDSLARGVAFTKRAWSARCALEVFLTPLSYVMYACQTAGHFSQDEFLWVEGTNGS